MVETKVETDRLIVRGGVIVTPESVFRGDILIAGETIAHVAPEIHDDRARIVDAHEYHVLPGLIDVHVHLREPGGTHKEDFLTGTRAAVAGGVTTILDMPNNPQPATSREALDEKRRLLKAKAVCDYGLYFGGTPGNASEAETSGAVAVKLYLGASTGDLLVADFASMYSHFAASGRLPIVVHAEDNEALQYFAGALPQGRHSERRPPLAAQLAVARAIAVAEATGRQVHIAHLSTARELALVKSARERGANVTCEVTPQHLFLSTEDEARLGPYGIVNPPLRSPNDVRALWNDVAAWDMVATDHAPHTIAEKESPKPPSGMPGLETLLPLLLTAVHEGRLSLSDVARLTSANPAHTFRIARKGNLRPGCDADLALVRLDHEYTLGKPWQTKCNWSPFEGRRVRGKVDRVWLRGREVQATATGLGEPGSGKEIELLNL